VRFPERGFGATHLGQSIDAATSANDGEDLEGFQVARERKKSK
jgi:hypothetical protein